MFWHRSALLQPAYCSVIAGLLHFYDLDNFPVATAPALSSPHFFTLPDTCLMQGISWAITFSRFGLCPIVTAPALCNAKGRGALPLWLYQLEDWSLAASRLVFWHRSALVQLAYCRVLAGLCTFSRFGHFPVATAPALSSAKGRGALPLCLYKIQDWNLAASRLALWHRSALFQLA